MAGVGATAGNENEKVFAIVFAILGEAQSEWHMDEGDLWQFRAVPERSSAT